MKRPILLPNYREVSWGWRYLAFEIVFLGYFLGIAIRFFRLPWSSTELNLTYFFLNFAAAAVIFRRFLRETALTAVKRIPAVLIAAVAGFFVYQLLSTAVSFVIVFLAPEFYNVNNENLSAISQKYYWLTALCTVFLVPITEELLHRGAIFGGLYRKNKVAAYAVSTLVFALVHITAYIGYFDSKTLLLCYLQYIPAGLCLAAAYHITGCIAAPILLHAAINAVGILAMR
ncbi:MAG: CPBP family intramembrane metalloprotease [Oscillospiraceae bacterium]|nr:CPBP family intramembrane metalloprotease [Oscillospiraceae bacterium]